MKAQSSEKFIDVSDVKVTDEAGYLSRNMTIRANLNDDSQFNNKMVKERIWINRFASEIEFQPLCSDTDAQLHDERIITVREEFETARANVQEVRLEPGRTFTWRFVMLDSWLASTEELAGMDMLCSDKTGTRTQNIMTIESKLPWCETLEQLLLLFALLATEWCSAR